MTALRIDSDYRRFRQIVRGQIRKDLKKFISSDEMIGRKGREYVSIPLPQIDIPHFRYGKNAGGVGAGEGDIGDPVAPGDGHDAVGPAGEAPGEHILEVDVSIDELAELMGEELELPKIQPKGKGLVASRADRYTGIAPAGPQGLRHFKRTYRRALIRQIASGNYDLDDPVVVPVREDARYRHAKSIFSPERKAVIIYMMDVSGSMGNEQKDIVRIEAFWIDTWLSSQYRGLETRFIIHDAAAREVDRATFFSTRENGGTVISSAYRACIKLIRDCFPPEEWNIYPFHFSDGDNSSDSDNRECVRLLTEEILPDVNIFCYGQVESSYGSGRFLGELRGAFADDDRVVTSKIEGREAILESIKQFLGKGR